MEKNIFWMCCFNIYLPAVALKKDGKNVCWTNSPTGLQLYCCYNHNEINNECIECSNGTLSENGLPCVPCQKNRYGYQCQHLCVCEDLRCDPVYGCIEVKFTSESNSNTQDFCSAAASPSIEVSTAVLTSDKSTHDVLLYCIVLIGGLLLVLLFGICLLQHTRRTMSRQVININEPENLSIHFYESVSDGIDAIPEAELIPNTRNSYLSIIDASSSCSSESNSCYEQSSLHVVEHLNPYQPTLPEYNNTFNEYNNLNKEVPVQQEIGVFVKGNDTIDVKYDVKNYNEDNVSDVDLITRDQEADVLQPITVMENLQDLDQMEEVVDLK